MSTRPLLSNGGSLPGEVVEAEPMDESVELRQQVADLQSQVDELQREFDRDRTQLLMLLQGIRAVFNGGSPDVASAVDTAPQPTPSAAYDAWKQRLPPACGRVIDALLIQPMGYVQLKNFCKMGASTLDQALAKLRANQLIEKDGTLNRLKRL